MEGFVSSLHWLVNTLPKWLRLGPTIGVNHETELTAAPRIFDKESWFTALMETSKKASPKIPASPLPPQDSPPR